ncbi:MAG: hypothetical protein DWC01_00445 [Candidatus Poseidoniales archaeon]|nr:MAG: hypothetical protein DWC01_00445 [Candidatus Poseidoniales archaeon]
MGGRQVAEEVNCMDDDVPFDDKAEQFDRLWDGITPKGVNRPKSLKFRQYILEHVRQMRRPLNRENARKYWMGELQKEIADKENF